MTQFHTDPNAAADAKPDAETFEILRGEWYWVPICVRCGQGRERHGPFAAEEQAIADAQTVGREGKT